MLMLNRKRTTGKKRSLWLAFFILITLIVPGCQSSDTPTVAQKMELVEEIKDFEQKLGFRSTENFKTYSDETEAYPYYFYTSVTELPYSLGDPRLQFGSGTPARGTLDSEKYDIYFYDIPVIAGIGTPVTKSLIRGPVSTFIRLIFHEDWHEQIDLPLGIEEPSAEVISYIAAIQFAREELGEDSAVYFYLRLYFSNRFREGRIYEKYYNQLSALYERFHSGLISEAATLDEKAELFASLGDELEYVWGGKPDQLNNAFVAYQMTYLRHIATMYQVYSANDFDLAKTVAIFQAMPKQGDSFDSLDKIMDIEKQVIDYLKKNL